MLRLAIAFLVGNLIVQHLSGLPDLGSTTAVIIAAGFGGVARWSPTIAGLGMGLFWSIGFAQHQLADRLDPGREGVDVTVVGVVVGLPTTDRVVSRFELDVDETGVSSTVPRRLRLSWYDATSRLHPGQRWQLTVRLKRPHGFMNPGGFDYESWLFRRGIGATGYVRASPAPRLLARQDGLGLDRLRQRLVERIHAALPDSPSAGIVAALAVGDRSGIDSSRWDVFAATGTSHLLAISGLHVGLVSGLAFWLIRRAWSRSAVLCRHWPSIKAGALAAILSACCYAALAGFSLPTRRALIMVAVALGAVLLARAVRPSQALAAALVLVLVLEPPASLAPGFWLSFGAVAIIVYLTTGRMARPRGLRHWGVLQLGLGLALAPLLLWFFQSASLVAPLANAIAIPWIGLLVVPLTLIGTTALAVLPPVGQVAMVVIDWILAPLWPPLVWLADLPVARWSSARPDALSLLLASLATLLILAPKGVPARWLGLVLLGPLVLRGPDRPPQGGFQLSVLDVGQGLASVVETAGHTLVFDVGARFGPRLDAGRAVVVPFLRARGIGSIDRLVVSHGDIDHSGGAPSLLSALPVGDVLGGPGVGQLHERQLLCRAGHDWVWDGVRFEILNPASNDRPGSENDGSCVIRVSGAGGAVLLTGDIEAAAEARLIANYGAGLASDLLVVPHHGSRSSSSEALIEVVSPAYAVVSAGYRSRYGFPKAEVCRRYMARGIPVLETSVEGGIFVSVFPAGGLEEPRGFRASTQRYWHIPKDGTCSPL